MTEFRYRFQEGGHLDAIFIYHNGNDVGKVEYIYTFLENEGYVVVDEKGLYILFTKSMIDMDFVSLDAVCIVSMVKAVQARYKNFVAKLITGDNYFMFEGDVFRRKNGETT